MPAISEDQLLPLPLQANTHKNWYALQNASYMYMYKPKKIWYIYIVNISKTPYITFNSKTCHQYESYGTWFEALLNLKEYIEHAIY